MTIILEHHHHHHGEISFRLVVGGANRIDPLKALLAQLEARVMATLQDILRKVEAEKTVEDSAVALLQSISQQLKDAIASNDPSMLQQIADQLDRDQQALADAVVQNTPAAPGA